MIHQFTSVALPSLKVLIIPVLSDNYSYVFYDDKDPFHATAVDVADAKLVQSILQSNGLRLSHILTTHGHSDHSQGNIELAASNSQVSVCGSSIDHIPALNKVISGNDHIDISAYLSVRVIATPCHTVGHLCYYIGDCLFSGDTLFSGGCGRFFEGTASQMHSSLSALAELPGTTNLFPGHEYTVKNLSFALTIEPDNQDIISKIEWAKKQRADELPTIPSTLADEKSINPFMRVHSPLIQSLFNTLNDPVKTMQKLRAKKDRY